MTIKIGRLLPGLLPHRWSEQNRHLWLRLLIVIGVLLLAAYFGPRASARDLLLVAGVGGVVVFLRKPELGLVALLISALAVPFAIGTGTQTSLNVPVLLVPLLVALWIADMVQRRDIRLAPSQVNAPLLAFVISASISLLAGNLPWFYFVEGASLQSQLGGWAIFAFSAGGLLLAANRIRELHWLEVFTWIFLAIGTIVVIGRIAPLIAVIGNRLLVQGADGSLFWTWLVALAGGQALFNRSMPLAQRLVLAGLVLATMWVNWSNRGWASGWAPSLVALWILLWLRSWRLGLLVTAAMTLGIWVGDPALPARLISGDQYSIDTRLVAWQIVVNYVLPTSPIFGLGPANYYHYTPLYPILGYSVKFNSHNQYIDILAQMGIVGLALFAWLMAAIGQLGWKLREQVGCGFARGYVYGCLGGLVGTIVAGWLGDWFLPFVYNIGLKGFRASVLGWLFLGGMVAVENFRKEMKLGDSGEGERVGLSLRPR